MSQQSKIAARKLRDAIRVHRRAVQDNEWACSSPVLTTNPYRFRGQYWIEVVLDRPDGGVLDFAVRYSRTIADVLYYEIFRQGYMDREPALLRSEFTTDPIDDIFAQRIISDINTVVELIEGRA